MERSEWERDRKMAVRHVIQGRSIVARRRECVERLARKGLDTTEAQRTLHMFTRTLNIFEDDLRRILAREPGKRKRQPPPRLVMRLIRRASGENRTTTGLPRAPRDARGLGDTWAGWLHRGLPHHNPKVRIGKSNSAISRTALTFTGAPGAFPAGQVKRQVTPEGAYSRSTLPSILRSAISCTTTEPNTRRCGADTCGPCRSPKRPRLSPSKSKGLSPPRLRATTLRRSARTTASASSGLGH